ncbi:MAG: hypothetical protein AB7I41_23785 [Candidatus Sericytochromatia bacterium]
MKSLAVFLCSTCLVLGMSWPVGAEVPSERPAEVFHLEPIDPFATENKDPVIVKYPDSVWVTSFVPGLGQILLDEPLRGWLFIGGFVLAFPVGAGAGALVGNALPPPIPDPNGGLLSGLNLNGPVFAVFGGMILPLAVYIWNLIDAYQLNIDKNKALLRAQSLSLAPDGQLIWKVSAF